MMAARRHALRWSLWLLVSMPALVTILLVFTYAVDVPFWDEWVVAGLLEEISGPGINLQALVGQHNEHRMLVPRAIQLAAALLVGRWDTRVGMWISQCLLIAMMAGCVVLWRRSLINHSSVRALVCLVAVALILFSPAQHQNLLWGFQLCFFIPAACLLASVLVISSPTSSLGLVLTVAAICCTVATFSIVPGLLTWPLSAAALLLTRPPRRDDLRKWLGWLACGAAVAVAYFLTYQPPAGTPSTWPVLTAPVVLLRGLAACLGGFMAVGTQPVRSATVAGSVVMAVFAWLALTLWRHRSDLSLLRASTPWFVMGSFGVVTAFAISVGRVGYGLVAMLESRYTSFTGWTLIAIVMLSAILSERLGMVSATRMFSSVVVATGVLSALAMPHHLQSIQRSYSERLQSLAIYTFAEVASRAHPMLPPWVAWPPFRDQLFDLEQRGWRARRPAAPTWIIDDEDTGCRVGTVEFQTTSGGRTLAGGWTYLPHRGQPANAVLVTVASNSSRRIVTVQPPVLGRADVGQAFDTERALVTGWTVEAPTPPSGETLEFWALDVSALRAFRLCHTGQR